MSSDLEGKQHTEGFIMRQGLKTDRIRKGIMVSQRIFDTGFQLKDISESFRDTDVGSLMTSPPNVTEMIKCLSDQVIFNEEQVETVVVQNFKFLTLICVLLLLLALSVLFLENVHKMKTTRVTPL